MAASNSPPSAAWLIWPLNEAAFSTHCISAIRHTVHLHPLMQLP